MVVLRPGNDDIDQSKITFGPLTKEYSSTYDYSTKILYEGEPLYCQYDGYSMNDNFATFTLTKRGLDQESVENSIRNSLSEVSDDMFKNRFTVDMLSSMQKSVYLDHLSYTGSSYDNCKVYDLEGHLLTYPLSSYSGLCDVIFRCERALFEQSSWKLKWSLVQIRRKAIRYGDSEYLFVDDVCVEAESNHDGSEAGYEHTEENYMFVPKPNNE